VRREGGSSKTFKTHKEKKGRKHWGYEEGHTTWKIRTIDRGQALKNNCEQPHKRGV